MPHVVRAGESTDSGLPGPVPGGEGLRVRWLIGSALGNAQKGILGELTLAPGAAEPLHRHVNVDEAAFVMSGAATVLTADGERALPEGALVLSPRGTWHGIRAGHEPVELLLIYGGKSDISKLAAEPGDGTAEGEAPQIINSSERPRNSVHNPDLGFFNMGASWLVSEEGLPGANLVVGAAVYGMPDTDGGHALHRHPAGEEFLYLRSGESSHLTEAGSIPMGPGDIAFIPTGEWHGIWNHSASGSHSVFGYLGSSSLEEAGYELPDAKE